MTNPESSVESVELFFQEGLFDLWSETHAHDFQCLRFSIGKSDTQKFIDNWISERDSGNEYYGQEFESGYVAPALPELVIPSPETPAKISKPKRVKASSSKPRAKGMSTNPVDSDIDVPRSTNIKRLPSEASPAELPRPNGKRILKLDGLLNPTKEGRNFNATFLAAFKEHMAEWAHPLYQRLAAPLSPFFAG